MSKPNVTLKNISYKVGDIVTRTTDHPKPHYIFEKELSDKGKVGVITEIAPDKDDDSILFYRLSDNYLYDETEIRLATEYEIRAALRHTMENYGRLAISL